MTCNFTWYNLPNQINKIIKPFTTTKVIWYNLPNTLTKVYNELVLLKSTCDKHPKFQWYALNKKAEAICEIVDCINAINVLIANYDNFTTNSGASQVIGNVLTNDTLNGVVVTPLNVNIINESADINGIILDLVTGDVSISDKSDKGVYAITYTIIEIANLSNTSTATVTVTIN